MCKTPYKNLTLFCCCYYSADLEFMITDDEVPVVIKVEKEDEPAKEGQVESTKRKSEMAAEAKQGAAMKVDETNKERVTKLFV